MFRPLTRRALLGGAAGAALAGCGRGGDEDVLRVWSMWGGDETTAFEQTLAAYNRARSPKRPLVNLPSVPDDKTIRALVAGAPPELFTLANPAMLGALAANGALRPLDDLYAASGLKEERFTQASLGQCRYQGKLYAVPFLVDCMVLLWNKKAFGDAGLDPETPPKTIEELEEFCRKLIRKGPDGRIAKIGLRPPDPLQVVAAFGGQLVDPVTGAITADHPRNVAAAAAFKRLMDAQGGNEAVAGFASGFANEMGSYNPFYLGQSAMVFTGQWYTFWTHRYSPQTDYGIAPLPYPAERPEQAGSAWLGGNLFCIPRESRTVEAAWDFLLWSQTPEGQRLFCERMHGVPNQRASLKDTQLRTGEPWRERFGKFMDLSDSPNAQFFPPMPVANLYSTELIHAFDAVRYGQQEPEAALAAVRSRVQPELDRYRTAPA